MRYVALLRGINVGGNTKVEMARLRAVFEKLGYTNVVTYINSGNVLFDDNQGKNDVPHIIEQAIQDEFALNVPVLVRTADEMHTLASLVPAEWLNDTVQRTDVLFLWDVIDNKEILTKIKINPDIERVMYTPGALIWNIERQYVTRGGGLKLIKSDAYKQMTIRNINTVRKLQQLVERV